MVLYGASIGIHRECTDIVVALDVLSVIDGIASSNSTHTPAKVLEAANPPEFTEEANCMVVLLTILVIVCTPPNKLPYKAIFCPT